jgi:hypothetical protein
MRRLGCVSFERMRSIAAGAPRSLAGLAINAAEAAFSAMGRKGANAWQANRRRAARYPLCIPRAHAMRGYDRREARFFVSSLASRHILFRIVKGSGLPRLACSVIWRGFGSSLQRLKMRGPSGRSLCKALLTREADDPASRVQ